MEKKFIIAVIFAAIIFVIFGCTTMSSAKFCGDSGLASKLPKEAGAVILADKTKTPYGCTDSVSHILGPLGGSRSAVQAEYLPVNPEPGICTKGAGTFCGNIVTIVEFKDRASVDAYINGMKSSSTNSGGEFYASAVGTNKIYYSVPDGNLMNLQGVSWTSGNNLISISLNSTAIVFPQVRDQLLQTYPSDVTE